MGPVWRVQSPLSVMSCWKLQKGSSFLLKSQEANTTYKIEKHDISDLSGRNCLELTLLGIVVDFRLFKDMLLNYNQS